ncbi:MAG: dTDP-glucose 4,6-dehydratase [Burkholderiaceae bacterium]|jgi:dTDP-glucose 4,6-dehydratase|nr:dTDP-glucose 4,6-dehydratase [Burkholderiaceae bacterium]
MILVTGGCGFIGARFVVEWLESGDEPLLNLDALTYAARPEALAARSADPRYRFVRGDVCDAALVAALLAEHRPRAIVHLAAETHVDRSIADAAVFGRTNALGTLVLLQAARAHLARLAPAEAARFRFLHCSTDEVFGSLGPDDEPCDENAPYRPRNPYAASKAAADHFVAAFHATHALPTLVTRGSNTYGPGQHPEKLVALAIERLLADEPVPLYGDGLAVRDWLYVSDHVSALRTVLERGNIGETYNVAGHQSVTNRELVERLIDAVDVERAAHVGGGSEARGTRIRFVADRPGHDRRYALDDRKLRHETGWSPQVSLDEGLRAAVRARLAPIDLGIENPP